jgi:hypothetical protein
MWSCHRRIRWLNPHEQAREQPSQNRVRRCYCRVNIPRIGTNPGILPVYANRLDTLEVCPRSVDRRASSLRPRLRFAGSNPALGHKPATLSVGHPPSAAHEPGDEWTSRILTHPALIQRVILIAITTVETDGVAAFCACCGAEITLKAEACPVCGTPRHGMVRPDPPGSSVPTDPSKQDPAAGRKIRGPLACNR